jgi:ABC-2 type transport system permease protein
MNSGMNAGERAVTRYRPSVEFRSLSFARGTLRVARVAPFRVLRGKRLLTLLLLVFCPVLVTLLMRVYGATSGLGVRGFVEQSTIFYLTVIFPVTLLFLGAAAIGDDIDNGTLLYLRLRPVGRAAIVCGRYLAAVLSATVLLAPPVILTYALHVGFQGPAFLIEQLPLLLVMLGNVLLGCLTYGALFLLFSLLIRHAVIAGLVFIAIWEVFISVFPSKAALSTVSFHLSAILWHQSREGGELSQRMSGFEESGLLPSALQSTLGLLVASAALLALSCWTFRNREYLERPGDA